MGGYLIAFLNLDKVIKIIRKEDEPKPVLMKTFRLRRASRSHLEHASALLAQARRDRDQAGEQGSARGEDQRRRSLLCSEKEQWKTVAEQIKQVREAVRPRREPPPSASAAPDFAEAPEHDEAAIRRGHGRCASRSPSWSLRKGWIRALRGHQTDLSGVVFKADDALKFAFPAETTSKLLVFATNGRFYTIDAAKLPGGRGHGEPVRLYADMEQDERSGRRRSRYQGGRKLPGGKQDRSWLRRRRGRVPRQHPQGQAGTQRQAAGLGARGGAGRGELAAAVGENRKMVIFPVEQVPEMARGRGVRLQRHKDGGLSDAKTFKAAEGLSWIDTANRTFNLSLKELAAWRGNRGDAGRVKPDRFLANLKFGRLPENGRNENGKNGGGEAK